MHAIRLVRAAVFAVVCVMASLVMHMLAGGGEVSPGVLVGALPLTGAGAFVLARRQRGFGVLMGASLATQYGLHTWFSAAAVSQPVLFEHRHGAGLSMLLVHVAAALLSAYWLERGESALATILRLLLASVLTLLVWRAPVVPRVASPARDDGRVPFVTRLLAAAVSRRGPPVPLPA
ncbi:hypothetical protein [Streptosporangium carneum]|uniref:Uncharacterized protein n=1 Tax=Streptosporangium carneum TaxID=47481 RepID=A0A9W6I700_9ACTN|nr:hypothetical protein [Streptosporangium carneum]GLK13216.1 hypothetical protein GCM10017600_66270 [Streptosporangium carneum]